MTPYLSRTSPFVIGRRSLPIIGAVKWAGLIICVNICSQLLVTVRKMDSKDATFLYSIEDYGATIVSQLSLCHLRGSLFETYRSV